MSTKKSIFAQLDEFLFSKLDIIANDTVVQKYNDAISALDENAQKIITQIITFALIIIPFVIALFFWIGNSSLRKDIEVKKNILDQIAIFEGNKSTLSSVSATRLSPRAITSKSELENRIRNLLSLSSIEQSKVQVFEFNQVSTSSSIAKAEAELAFTSFGTRDFSRFISALLENEKFKILNIDLKKNNETNLLSGKIKLMHMGQNSLASEENDE